MQNGSNASSADTQRQSIECTFCQQDTIESKNILKETTHFIVVADHAPLVEGHILIIPRQHYACYGAVPSTLDQELFTLKHEIQQFFDRFYAPCVFWEHGVFRQTVFHAHLHCFPFGNTIYDLTKNVHSMVVHSQDDIRRWFTAHGHYFYMEDAQIALLFAPDMDRYHHIIQDVLRYGVAARNNGYTAWRSAHQRYIEGVSLISALTINWQSFQQDGAKDANETHTR